MKRIYIFVLFICMVASATGYILYQYHRDNVNSVDVISLNDQE